MSIQKSAKSVVFSGGHVQGVLSDRNVIYCSAIKRCVLRLLSLRIFKVGVHYIVQREVAPIGGPISSQLLDLVLLSIETRFDTKFWPLMARLLDLPVQ